jgi:hypothetical protein
VGERRGIKRFGAHKVARANGQDAGDKVRATAAFSTKLCPLESVARVVKIAWRAGRRACCRYATFTLSTGSRTIHNSIIHESFRTKVDRHQVTRRGLMSGLGTEPLPTKSRVVTVDARPEAITMDTAKTAVIVVDMQNDFGSKRGMFDRSGHDISVIQNVVGQTAKVLAFTKPT